jgi:hypothetical protein
LNKRVIIVGNGEGVLQKKNGHIIDSFDYVVRMGDCKIKGYEEYTGTRTDMLRVVWKRHFFISESNNITFYDTETSGFKDILFTEIKDCDNFYEITTTPIDTFFNHLKDDIFAGSVTSLQKHFIYKKRKSRILHDMCLDIFLKYHPQVENIFFYEKKQRYCLAKQFCNNKKIIPSNGIITIDYIINTMHNCDIYITGFDGFATGYYWKNTETFFCRHNSAYEQLFIKNLIKSGRIKILE